MNQILALLFLGTITLAICAASKRVRHHNSAAVKQHGNQPRHMRNPEKHRHARSPENQYDDETYEEDTGADEDVNEDTNLQRKKRALTNPDDSEVLTEIEEQDSNDQLFPVNDDVEIYENEEQPIEEEQK